MTKNRRRAANNNGRRYVAEASHERGVPVDRWLDLFYRPEDYVQEGTCAVFREGEFTEVRREYESALTLAFREGGNGRVRFVPSLLHRPRAACMVDSAARKRVCIVRKSSDALYARGHVCGGPDRWEDTAAAMGKQVARLLSFFRNPGAPERERAHAENVLEVAMHTLRTLAFFCDHVPELRDHVRDRLRSAASRGSSDDDDSEHCVLSAALGERVESRRWTLAWFLRWYAYCGEDGDVTVGVHHAMEEADKRGVRPRTSTT